MCIIYKLILQLQSKHVKILKKTKNKKHAQTKLANLKGKKKKRKDGSSLNQNYYS